MTFEDWYLKEIGVTVADAEARNVYDRGIMRKCWAESGAEERERIASLWAGCYTDAEGHGRVDIGASIRAGALVDEA